MTAQPRVALTGVEVQGHLHQHQHLHLHLHQHLHHLHQHLHHLHQQQHRSSQPQPLGNPAQGMCRGEGDGEPEGIGDSLARGQSKLPTNNGPLSMMNSQNRFTHTHPFFLSPPTSSVRRWNFRSASAYACSSFHMFLQAMVTRDPVEVYSA
jgi:hypothetical protein